MEVRVDLGVTEGVQSYIGRLEWKKAFGGNVRRYGIIIETDFQEMEWSGETDWTGLAETSTGMLL